MVTRKKGVKEKGASRRCVSISVPIDEHSKLLSFPWFNHSHLSGPWDMNMELFYAVAINERSFKKQLVIDNHMKRMGWTIEATVS